MSDDYFEPEFFDLHESTEDKLIRSQRDLKVTQAKLALARSYVDEAMTLLYADITGKPSRGLYEYWRLMQENK